jgi:hypothetical protein
MTTGNPVFSNNTDLNYYNLVFVFARITPPQPVREGSGGKGWREKVGWATYFLIY